MKFKIQDKKLNKRVKQIMKECGESEPSEYVLLRARFETKYNDLDSDDAFLLRAGEKLSKMRTSEEDRKYRAGELWAPSEVLEFVKKVTGIWTRVLVGEAEPYPPGYKKRFPGIESAIDECVAETLKVFKNSPDLSKRKKNE